MIIVRSKYDYPPCPNKIGIAIAKGPIGEDVRAALEADRRNWEWAQQHWCDFMPAARGRIIVIADSEGTIVDSVQEARTWLAQNHPNDPSPITKYVLPHPVVKVYAELRYR